VTRTAARRRTGSGILGFVRRLGGLSMLAVAVGMVSSAAAAPRPPLVTLGASPVQLQPNGTVKLSARTGRPALGDTLLIRATHTGKVETIARCRAQTCRRSWTENAAGIVGFQALLLRRGKVVGRSRAVTVRWTVAPAPQPAAAAGHYCGFTNEGKSICFDVKADQHVVNLRTESIVTCPDSMRWLWTIGFSVADPLRALAFTYSYSGPLAADPTDHNVSATYALAGTFDTAGNASGTIELRSVAWDAVGVHHDCAGEPRTWTARLGA
jgi:hypothetical protein